MWRWRFYYTVTWNRWAAAIQGGWNTNANGYLTEYGLELRVGPLLMGVTNERMQRR